ncbi:hypothetical protein LEP1GSC059_0484 [Leptospira noguchii serovar Panama str. CZ214]|uniref:Uncharacterized protein n=1 Tax=Leptospira noguchii serovar Panama str. CZ214 TaxID=1001595 RepID=T0GWJ8_9LEPT|nr:hypothetical protein LEP1GSC059_0484 [Leptospira noguchii serovar Panama str. CZ214]
MIVGNIVFQFCLLKGNAFPSLQPKASATPSPGWSSRFQDPDPTHVIIIFCFFLNFFL